MHTCDPSTQEFRQEDQDFKASLRYMRVQEQSRLLGPCLKNKQMRTFKGHMNFYNSNILSIPRTVKTYHTLPALVTWINSAQLQQTDLAFIKFNGFIKLLKDFHVKNETSKWQYLSSFLSVFILVCNNDSNVTENLKRKTGTQQVLGSQDYPALLSVLGCRHKKCCSHLLVTFCLVKKH